MERHDGVQGRDVLGPLGFLHRLTHDGSLLREPFNLLCGERLAGACSSHRIAINGAIGRVWQRGGERTGEVEHVTGTLVAIRRGREGRLGTCAQESCSQARAVGRRLSQVVAHANVGSKLVEGWKSDGSVQGVR